MFLQSHRTHLPFLRTYNLKTNFQWSRNKQLEETGTHTDQTGVPSWEGTGRVAAHVPAARAGGPR